ncbi:MAG: hypothetical protein E5Y73_31665 [Mesorhizobium sp.]|uniref:hypothetical protein n=1 Tax=Mesorhizobium sp. TaxID=1871066 RepID=UPI0012060B46|nr:hypothetical protein [Mesorhizobium sp.]TIL84755.1 MAG: hypothetical protein E5Y73_31665 [Mesorhizobium sp.]
MSEIDEQAAHLVDMGYTPLYAVDKRCAAWGWATVQPTTEWLATAHRKKQFIVDKDGPHRRRRRYPNKPGAFIEENGFKCRPQAIALRLDHGLAVIDLDIDHPIIETLARRVLDVVPALYDAPVRTGSGVKEAWFCRAGPDADFSRLPNRLWVPPGVDTKAETIKTHQVEIFGGGGEVAERSGVLRKPKKYFGAFGAHTVELSTEKVLRSYAWVEDYSPAIVPLDSLPVLSMADFRKVLDTAEATLVEHGWQAIPRSSGGGSLSGRMTPIYDLTEGMDLDGYRLSDLYQMAESGAIGRGIRTQISPVPWLRPSSSSGASCCITVTARGAPAIIDWQENTMHLPAELRADIDDLIAEKLRKLSQRKPSVLDVIEQEWRRRDAVRAGIRK